MFKPRQARKLIFGNHCLCWRVRDCQVALCTCFNRRVRCSRPTLVPPRVQLIRGRLNKRRPIIPVQRARVSNENELPNSSQTRQHEELSLNRVLSSRAFLTSEFASTSECSKPWGYFAVGTLVICRSLYGVCCIQYYTYMYSQSSSYEYDVPPYVIYSYTKFSQSTHCNVAKSVYHLIWNIAMCVLIAPKVNLFSRKNTTERINPFGNKFILNQYR